MALRRWAKVFPALQDSPVQAARAVDGRLVSFENVYMSGDTGGESITEITLANPHTRKSEVRLVRAQQLRLTGSPPAPAPRPAKLVDQCQPYCTGSEHGRDRS